MLGASLFSLYVFDLPNWVRHCNIHLYADDVQIYFSVQLDDAVEVIRCRTRINIQTKYKCILQKYRLKINTIKTSGHDKMRTNIVTFCL